MQLVNSPVYFWGQLLGKSDLKWELPATGASSIQIKNQEESHLLFREPFAGTGYAHNYYFKPPANPPSFDEKTNFNPAAAPEPYILKKQESMIMLHPLLPEYFMLLFKDRQLVNIVLEFRITESNGRNYTILKRKVSSGNLDADLLTMRYISHYLSIQGEKFPKDTWQTITIELSTLKNAND